MEDGAAGRKDYGDMLAIRKALSHRGGSESSNFKLQPQAGNFKSISVHCNLPRDYVKGNFCKKIGDSSRRETHTNVS